MRELLGEAGPQRLGLVSLSPLDPRIVELLGNELAAVQDDVVITTGSRNDVHAVSFQGTGRALDAETVSAIVPSFVAHAATQGDMAINGPSMVVTDVDSTFIRNEVIELLARRAGCEDEVRAITESAMRGELDFTQSLHKRVSQLAGLPISIVDEVLADITVTPGAAELVELCHQRGCLFGLVSGGFTQVLNPLARDHHVDLWRAIDLEVVRGRLTGHVCGDIVDGTAKREIVTAWAHEHQIDLSLVACIGDGANDLSMMDAAGLGIGFCAKPVVHEHADAHIDFPRLDAAALLWGWF